MLLGIHFTIICSVVVMYPKRTEAPLNCVAAWIKMLKQAITANSPCDRENKEMD